MVIMVKHRVTIGISLILLSVILGILLRVSKLLWEINMSLTKILVNGVNDVVINASTILSYTASIPAVWIIVMLLMITAFIKSNDLIKVLITALLINLMLSEIATLLLKYHISIPRPGLEQVSDVSSYAYPSGHVARATTTALWLSRIIGISNIKPKRFIKVVIWLWVLIISICRVTSLNHYVLDLLGGFLLSLGSYSLILRVVPIIRERLRR